MERYDSEKTFVGYFLLSIAVAFTGWGFFHELFFIDVQYSDVSFHLSVLRSLDVAVQGAQNPLDFWYDGVPYGFALFRSYQYLPYLFMYGVFRLSGELLSLSQVLFVSTFVLATLLPVSIYCGVRLLGTGALEAGIAAVLAVLISDGSEYGMGLHNFTFGTAGIITQLWAMFFLLPAISAAYRYLHDGLYAGWAVLLVFLTFGSHVVAAVILLVCVGVFSFGVLVQNRKMWKRCVLLFILIALATAHQWWFVFTDAPYINRSQLEPAWKYQGRGLDYLSTLFWTGGFFDCDRIPVVTLLVLISFGYSVIYWNKISGGRNVFFKYVPILFLTFFSLCVGRDIWGGFFSLIPPFRSLHVHRFASGAHLFGILLIALAVGTFIRRYATTSPRTILSVFFFLILLRPAFLERRQMFLTSFDRHQATAQLVEQDLVLSSILSSAESLPHGWTYIGSSSSWKKDLLVAGYIPLDLFTIVHGIPTVGGVLYHAFSLAGETLFDFDPNNPAHFDLFGIRSIISPSFWKGTPGFSLVRQTGRFAVWVRDSHMLFIGDTRFLSGDLTGRTDLVRSFVQGFTSSVHEGAPVITQQQTNPWTFDGTVKLDMPSVVVAAVGFHPNWKATVDMVSVKPRWVLPGLTAIDCPQGTHKITFTYEGSRFKIVLLALSIVTILFTFIRQIYAPTKPRMMFLDQK